MKKLKVWAATAAMAAVVVLAGCAQFGLAPAQSFDEQLAYGYSTVTAVRTTAASAVVAGTLSVPDGQYVLTATDSARAGLDGARAVAATGNTSGAMGKLTMVTAALAQLQQYLIAKGVH